MTMMNHDDDDRAEARLFASVRQDSFRFHHKWFADNVILIN